MLAYRGTGYTEAFTANYDRAMERLNAGEDILVVAGPDDICAALLGEPDCHCHFESIALRDGDAAAAVSAQVGRPIAAGDTLALDVETLATLRDAFTTGAIRKACGAYPGSAACEWYDLCSAIAAKGFADAKLNRS